MRDYGSGTIRKRADGRWEGKIALGVDEKGKPRRKSVYGKTRSEVARKMREIRREYEDTGTIATDRRATLGVYIEQYVGTTLEARVVAGTLKRSTAEWHEAMLRHTEPLHRKRLDSITPADVEKLIAGLDVAASTRRGIFTALSKLMDAAVRDGLVTRNPCAALDRPVVDRDEARHLSVEEVRALVEAAEGWMETAILLMAHTGLRRGELLALVWGDIADDHLTVSGTITRTKAQGLVRTVPKTRAGRRTIPLSSAAQEALRVHKASLGAAPLPSAPVFASKTGGFQEPRNFNRKFDEVAAAAKIDATPHALRHSAATVMVVAGVPLPVVADVLGHADIRITTSVYTHIVDEEKRRATDALGKLLGS